MNAIREDTENKGLLFAGTELGIYVSFDDGDHWQPLQLNLPVTSVRDITIHGDDLVIATHGRSFWILDDITPLRQMNRRRRASARLYQAGDGGSHRQRCFPRHPAAAGRADGEESARRRHRRLLPARGGEEVTLEIFDSSGKLVRRYSSGPKKEQPHPPMAIAERWLPKPVVLENAAGAHRFVWDLRWGSSGANRRDRGRRRLRRAARAARGAGKLSAETDGRRQHASLSR